MEWEAQLKQFTGSSPESEQKSHEHSCITTSALCLGHHDLYVLDLIVSMLSIQQFPLFHCMSYCYKLLFVIWCLKVNIAKVVNPLAMVYQAYWLIWRHKSFLDTFMFHFPRAVSLVNFSICAQSRNQYLKKKRQEC